MPHFCDNFPLNDFYLCSIELIETSDTTGEVLLAIRLQLIPIFQKPAVKNVHLGYIKIFGFFFELNFNHVNIFPKCHRAHGV